MDIKSVYKPVLTSGVNPPYSFKKADYIYLDNAASTPLILEAKEAMQEYFFDNFANSSSSHAAGRRVKAAIEAARTDIASCINASSEEIFFTSGASEALNTAISGYYNFQPERAAGRSIVIGSTEHPASLYPALELTRYGVKVFQAAPQNGGAIGPDSLQSYISSDRKLDFAAFMLVNNETGIIQPVAKLASLAHKHGACFLCDAVAAAGKIPIDVRALGADMLAMSAHKFFGPKGCGILYVRRGTRLCPRVLGGGQESGLRAGTHDVPAIIGAAAALKKAVNDIESRQKHCALLKNYLYKKFEIFKQNNIDIRYNSPDDISIASTVSVSFKNVEAERLVEFLSSKGIMVSAGSACSSKGGSARVSHVIEAMKLPFEYAMGTIRISFGLYNELCDIDILTTAIMDMLKK